MYYVKITFNNGETIIGKFATIEIAFEFDSFFECSSSVWQTQVIDENNNIIMEYNA